MWITVQHNHFACTYMQNAATSLHLASLNGHVEVVEILIKSEADINFVTEVSYCEDKSAT